MLAKNITAENIENSLNEIKYFPEEEELFIYWHNLEFSLPKNKTMLKN